MVIATVRSKNGVVIRLTQERWKHITTSHLEINAKDFDVVMSVMEDPDFILYGDFGELLAVKKKARSKSWIVVPYKETVVLRTKEIEQTDGFVLTAYLTTDLRWLFQRKIIWSKE